MADDDITETETDTAEADTDDAEARHVADRAESAVANLAHPMADGSVHFLSEHIDMKTYHRLGNREDNEPVVMP